MDKCRLCGKKADPSTFNPLLESTELLMKIRKTLPIVVIEGDPLPQGVCPPCVKKVEEFHSFYEETMRADLSLRSQLFCGINQTSYVTDPMVIFQDTRSFFTAAYKLYDGSSKPKIWDNFVLKTIDETTLYSCKKCKRTYLSEDSALKHECNDDTRSKSFLSLATPAAVSAILHLPKVTPHIAEEINIEDSSSDDIEEILNKPKSKEPTKIEKEARKEQEFYFKKAKRKRKSNSSNESEIVRSTFSNAQACQLCPQTFTREEDLVEHRRTHLPWVNLQNSMVPKEQKHMYPCSYCNLSFTRKTTLLSHEQDHLEKKFSDDWSDGGG